MARFKIAHGDSRPGRCPLPGRLWRFAFGFIDSDHIRCSCGARWEWGRFSRALGVPRRGRAWIRRG